MSGDDSDSKKQPDPPAAATPSKPTDSGAGATITVTPATQIPPIPAQQIPQVLALQMGVGLPQQQNPEVIGHITAYLAHDSDNRLEAMNATGKRNHTFRMTAVSLGAGLALLLLVVPLFAELYRGDMQFVRDFVEKYLPVTAMIILALLAGSKLNEIFKG